MPKTQDLIKQIFGIRIPKKKSVIPFNFINKAEEDEEILPQLDIEETIAPLMKQVQLSDVKLEDRELPPALRRTDVEEEIPFVEEASFVKEFEDTVETQGQKFSRETSEFIKSPEFSYMLASLGASIGGKDSVGGKLGAFAIEQIQSSVFEDYMSALEAGEDVSKIPGVSLLPVAIKTRALQEKRAEGELVVKEREVATVEEEATSLSKYRTAYSENYMLT